MSGRERTTTATPDRKFAAQFEFFKFGAIVACLALSPTIFAQQAQPATGSITGVVQTEEAAAVPGATLKLTNIQTHKVWVSWSDESGKFEVPNLPIGPYSIETSQLGFVTTMTQAQVSAAASTKIEIVLRVATLAELESHPGNPSAARPAMNRRFGGARARRNSPLPPGVLNALNQGSQSGFTQTDLTGEAGAQTQEESANTGEMPVNADASGSSSSSFLLQGTIGQGQGGGNGGQGFGPGGFGGFGAFGQPQVGSLAPEVPGGPGGIGGPRGMGGQAGPGRPPGGGSGPGGGPGGGRGGFRGGFGGGGVFAGRGGRLARQAVNRVRFSFYDRYENSAADAQPFSLTGNQFPKTSHYDERVGGNVGGPLIIPHIYNGSDKTFVFVNYQHDTDKSPVDTFSTVPTLSERSGDFCGQGVTLYNPYSDLSGTSGPRTPLGTNGCQIPSGMIKTAAQGLLNYIPLPNVPGQTVQNYVLNTTEPENTDLVNAHVLHTINGHFGFNGGYNFNSQRRQTFGSFADILGQESTRSQNVDLSLIHNWSSHFVEDSHLNWSRNRIQLLSDNAYVKDVAGDLGITGISTQPIDYGIPQISFTNFSSLNDPVPSLVRDQTLRYNDGSTWVHENHTLKFGGEVRRIQLNTASDPTPRGDFIFTGLMTSQLDSNGQPEANTGNDLGDFLLGLPYNTKAQYGNPNSYFRNWGFVAYAQDDWRVQKRFTAFYGLRYEAVTPPVELYDQIANLDLNAAATAVDVVTPGETGTYDGAYPVH